MWRKRKVSFLPRLYFETIPSQALRAAEGCGSPNRHSKVVRLSPLRTGRLYPQEISLVLISVGGWVDPRATVRPEGLSHKNIPVTPRPSGLYRSASNNCVPRMAFVGWYLLFCVFIIVKSWNEVVCTLWLTDRHITSVIFTIIRFCTAFQLPHSSTSLTTWFMARIPSL